MFCNQCEQARGGRGCSDVGTCGKDADVQSLQETLLYGVKGMAAYAHHARRLGMVDEAVDAWQSVVRIRPKFAQGHENLGYALYKRSKFADALAQARS